MNGDTQPTPPRPAADAELSQPAPAQPPAAQDQPLPPADSAAALPPAADAPAEPPEVVQWASADMPHHKPAGWFAIVLAGAAALAAVVYLLTRDMFSSVSIVMAALLFGLYGARKPQAVHYQLDSSGITIDRKHYAFSQFRSFAVDDGGAAPDLAHSIVLMPLKRFMPLLTVNCPVQMEDVVIGRLSAHLPLEAYRRDAMDALARKMRF